MRSLIHSHPVIVGIIFLLTMAITFVILKWEEIKLWRKTIIVLMYLREFIREMLG